MKKSIKKGELKVLGIDLTKQSFHLHGVDAAGQTVLNKKLNRKQLSAFVAQLPLVLLGWGPVVVPTIGREFLNPLIIRYA